jgi:hypothetical protein
MVTNVFIFILPEIALSLARPMRLASQRCHHMAMAGVGYYGRHHHEAASKFLGHG